MLLGHPVQFRYNQTEPYNLRTGPQYGCDIQTKLLLSLLTQSLQPIHYARRLPFVRVRDAAFGLRLRRATLPFFTRRLDWLKPFLFFLPLVLPLPLTRPYLPLRAFRLTGAATGSPMTGSP